MKKATKKNPSKAKRKAVRNLDVKPSKGGTVRGGFKNYIAKLDSIKGETE